VELPERLVPEAHPEHRDPVLGARRDDVEARAGALGRPGPRRDEDAVDVARVGGDVVVALDDGGGAELLEVPDDRPHEAVVVVDDEDAGHAPSSIVVSLNGMYGAISGKSHVKHT